MDPFTIKVNEDTWSTDGNVGGTTSYTYIWVMSPPEYEVVAAPESTDASLTSVLDVTDSNPGEGNGSDASNAIEWKINVVNNVEKLQLSDIVVAAGATAELYSDNAYSQDKDADIILTEGGNTKAYIIVTAEDGITKLYYAVTINRADS